MIEIRRYTDLNVVEWNKFNRNTKNRLFMFDRNYMDYHRDRFSDHSLMFYREGQLIALLPACEKGELLHSHGALTYGGFLTGSNMKQHIMNECMEALILYCGENGIHRILYKAIPYVYFLQPAEEDRYALYAVGGHLITVDAATYIDLADPIKMPKGRKAQIARARREGVTIEILDRLDDYRTFIEIENEVLESRHHTRAVHTAEELKMLHDRFPENIHLFGATKDGKMIAGVIIFEYDRMIHTQYMGANTEARVIGALDLTVYTIIERYKPFKKWLDFGISTEHDMIYLNEGLIAQKESFGGRTGVYETWEIKI